MPTFDITYEGTPAYASILATMLEREGCEVEYEAPMEGRGPGMAEVVVVGLVVRYVGDAGRAGFDAALRKFRERAPRAKVKPQERLD